ncbi:MAG: DUF4136 domain-containing protein [Alistipes sp.]|nr:DUF4136 domain-containing protein [Alistipes sp.]
MNSKQLFSSAAIVALLLAASCQKDPSTSSLSKEYLVYTACDTERDFAGIERFYLPDSILLIGTHAVNEAGDKVSKYWSDSDALSLVNTVASEMADRGYTRVKGANRATAEVGFQLSYVEETAYFTGYSSPYWWWDDPYYWSPSYWGYWGGWYYPFAVYYSYTTGSLLVELVDLRSEEGADRKLSVLWNSYISGLLEGKKIRITDAVDALQQAFTQSPYLKNSTVK